MASHVAYFKPRDVDTVIIPIKHPLNTEDIASVTVWRRMDLADRTIWQQCITGITVAGPDEIGIELVGRIVSHNEFKVVITA